MFLEVSILLTSGLLLAVLTAIATKIITNRLSLIKFEKLSRGMPMFPDISLLGNHILTLFVGKGSCNALLEIHKKHETIGWLMGDQFCVSTTNLDLMKTIIQNESDIHCDRVKANIPADEFENSIMLVPEPEWRRLRRVFAPAMKSNKFKTPNVVMEIETSINKLVESLEKRLDSNEDLTNGSLNSCEINVDDLVQKYSHHLAFACLYKQYDLIDFDDPQDKWTVLIEKGLEEVNKSWLIRVAMVFPCSASLIDWLMWHFHEQGYARQKLLEFVKLQTKIGIEARTQLNKSQKNAEQVGNAIDRESCMLKDGTMFKRNLVDTIIEQFMDGKLTKREYFNSSCFLFAAADRTSSDVIVHTIYLLSIHQDVQDKLRESIKIEGADSEYLAWVIMESQRVLPSVPTGCSRAVNRDIEIEGGKFVVPKSTFVHMNAYVIHRLKKYWGDDADEFRPERWQNANSFHPLQFIPFGAGNRQCLGKDFALFQMKTLFSTLLMRYKFEGKPRDDAYVFDSPIWAFLIPNSLTRVKISRLTN